MNKTQLIIGKKNVTEYIDRSVNTQSYAHHQAMLLIDSQSYRSEHTNLDGCVGKRPLQQCSLDICVTAGTEL